MISSPFVISVLLIDMLHLLDKYICLNYQLVRPNVQECPGAIIVCLSASNNVFFFFFF